MWAGAGMLRAKSLWFHPSERGKTAWIYWEWCGNWALPETSLLSLPKSWAGKRKRIKPGRKQHMQEEFLEFCLMIQPGIHCAGHSVKHFLTQIPALGQMLQKKWNILCGILLIYLFNLFYFICGIDFFFLCGIDFFDSIFISYYPMLFYFGFFFF